MQLSFSISIGWLCVCAHVCTILVVGTQTAVYHTDEPQPWRNSRLRLFHVLFEMTGSHVHLPSE